MELIRNRAIKIVTFFLIEFYPAKLILYYTPGAEAEPLNPISVEEPLAESCHSTKQQSSVFDFSSLNTGKESYDAKTK